MSPPPESRRPWCAALLVFGAAAALAPHGAQAAPAGSPWGASYFPDVQLVSQDGRSARFYSDLVKGRFVVVNFIFTQCRAACPLETANLARVQRRLAGRMGRDLYFYSISVDPEHDTPEVLKDYAARYGAGPGWLFLTGARQDVERLRAALGDRAPWKNHGIGLTLGNDPAGQWTSLSAVDDPGFLAASIGEWMTTSPGSHAPVPSYADAPSVRSDRGADLFRTRCAACHVGPGSVGPRLSDVALRRNRAWLARWLTEPEALVREGDPVARGLVARLGRITMPRFDLTDGQLADLLSYLERKGDEPRRTPEGVPAGTTRPDRR